MDHTIHLDYDGTNALYLPTTVEASDAAVRSKYDDAVDADPTLPAVWSPDNLGARKSIKIAGDVTPTIEAVSAPGTPSGTYGVGETIDLEVVFTTRVFVKDSVSLPYLLVEAGDERGGEEASVSTSTKNDYSSVHSAMRTSKELAVVTKGIRCGYDFVRCCETCRQECRYAAGMCTQRIYTGCFVSRLEAD